MRRVFRCGDVMASVNRIIAALAAAAALHACVVGPKSANFTPAHDPAGVRTSLALMSGAAIDGELLSVEQSALIVVTGERVTRVPFSSIRRGTFHQVRMTLANAQSPSAVDRERLRLLSRYPQGLTPQLLASLLAAYGQSEIATVP